MKFAGYPTPLSMMATDLGGFSSNSNVTYMRSQPWVVRTFSRAVTNFASSELFYTGWNKPFTLSDRGTAEEMFHDEETGLNRIRETLLHSWRQASQRPQSEPGAKVRSTEVYLDRSASRTLFHVLVLPLSRR